MSRLRAAPEPESSFGSLGAELLIRYGELAITHERMLAAGEAYAALRLQRALDFVGYAHKLLGYKAGSALVMPGEPEPVDTWDGAA